MKIFSLHIRESKFKTQELKKFLILFCILTLSSWFVNAQVTSSIDTTTIKIGEQILYKIQVEVDSTDLVVFPEGQTFSPFEIIESFPTDTTKREIKYSLIKEYGLTKFDSGNYYIPKQKVIIGEKTFFTDSVQVEVNTIEVDTTKQGLYDIKPLLEIEKPRNNSLLYWLAALLAIIIVGVLLYWFIWREKPLTEEEKIALLPPYDRAKLALQKLDDSKYLENKQLKEYYSELTFAIRKYLDEKVYDRALESTTDELILRLNLLKDGNQFDLSKDSIKNIESILKRADLVKFAKSAPDVELAKMDRNTVDLEIDHVKEILPEPSEEEKLLDQQYREAQERKAKRNKIIVTCIIVLALLLVTYAAFGVKYGFKYVNDTITMHQGKKLLEGKWVQSDYGFPPISINTPKVLKRMDASIPDELKDKVKMTMFGHEEENIIAIVLATTTIAQAQDSLDISLAVEGSLKTFEDKGAKNIITKNDKFTTPNGAEGLKTHGTMQMPEEEGSTNYIDAYYSMLSFTSNNQVIQQVIINWRQEDEYVDEAVNRIINSIELQEKTE